MIRSVSVEDVEQAIEHACSVWSRVTAILGASDHQEVANALRRLSSELPLVAPTLDRQGSEAWTFPDLLHGSGVTTRPAGRPDREPDHRTADAVRAGTRLARGRGRSVPMPS